MITVLLQMAAIIVCGVLWRWLRPGGMDLQAMRRALTDLVYYLLLPALVLQVLWRSPLGVDAVQVAILAAVGVIAGMLLMWMVCRMCRMPRAAAGALLLATMFPNATYLGLPVLEATLGPWASRVAIQYDLFACTPLLFTLGIVIAHHYGGQGRGGPMWLFVLRIPPLWAALLAVVLNLGDVPSPVVVDGVLRILASGVVPLMLFSLGLSLTWQRARWRQLPSVIPVIVIQLVLVPLIVLGLAGVMGIKGGLLSAVVLEAAMPSMVLGIVICERYGLDNGLYATAVTATTVVSLLSLPLWIGILHRVGGI